MSGVLEAPPVPQPSTRSEMDAALARLAEGRATWVRIGVEERIDLLADLARSFFPVSKPWAHAVARAEGLDPSQPAAGEEWLVGPYFVLRNLHLLRRSLMGIRDTGRPRVPGPIHALAHGQVAARVFPELLWDRLFYPGIEAEVWMEPGVTLDTLPQTQARAYHESKRSLGTALVLGGGNVSSIGPLDALYKLFVENRVVLLKAHPVNAYLGPLLKEGFAPLFERGVFDVVYGGADEGAYLCEHELVDEIHVTGSDRTYEAIVFGPGEEGARNRSEGRRKLHKPVTGELGNVSPVIIVPGDWSRAQMRYQAENIVSMVANNAGFNCNAGRLMITQRGWKQRDEFLDAVREEFRALPPRRAYYPGARQAHAGVVETHPHAELIGNTSDDALPWTLVPDLDPTDPDEICFRREAFCSLIAETALEAPSVPSFLSSVTDFCNETLWGTLNATIVVDGRTKRDPTNRRALEEAIEGLRYGTICINHWAAIGFGLGLTPWGAFPGHAPEDIQSGIGVVHNTLMFDRVQKTVITTPFRAFPKPPWFVRHRTAHILGERLTAFEQHPRLSRLPGISWAGLRA